MDPTAYLDDLEDRQNLLARKGIELLFLGRSGRRLVTIFFIIKPTTCTYFSNLFWKETLHVSDSSSVHHQEFFTVHTAKTYVIQVC